MAELETIPPAHTARRFTPPDANLRDPQTVADLYAQLLARPIASESQLDAWAEDESELASAIDQAGSTLYVNMTCNTDNPAHADAYRNYINTVPPGLKPLTDAFHKKYLVLRKQFPRTSPRFDVFVRRIETETALFREENVPLQTREDLLSQDYQTLMGAQMTPFNGKEYTAMQMMKFLQEPDRDLREAAWRALSKRRLADKDAIHAIFTEQVSLRHQQARNAGHRNYVDYAFAQKHRYDYTRDDCREFHDAAGKWCTPLKRDYLERRRKRLGVDRLRPWDLHADPEGKPPLRPCANASELVEKMHRVFEDMDAELAANFEFMRAARLLDLENRKGKAPGGYQLTLQEARCPFIFMNAVGLDGDMWVLLHEAGHAFHAQLSAHNSLLSYRNPPIEFCEVASFGMELLGGDFIHRFYMDHDDQARSRRDYFEGRAGLLAWVATVDAFQHWLYEQHEFDAVPALAQWVKTMERFSGGVIDWSGLEEEQAHAWHAQPHFFTSPMYYIEYGIALLGALQLWTRSRHDRATALAQYKAALSLGGSRSLPELFAAAGLDFDLSERTIAPITRTLEQELFNAGR